MARSVRGGAGSQAVRDYLKVHPQAGPKEIVDGLKSRGVTVSLGLVRSIKYGGKRAGSRKSAKPQQPASRSESIRGFLLEHPDAKPTEVRVALAKQGIKVDSRLISDVKRSFNPKRRASRPQVAVRKTSVDPNAVEMQGDRGADPVTIPRGQPGLAVREAPMRQVVEAGTGIVAAVMPKSAEAIGEVAEGISDRARQTLSAATRLSSRLVYSSCYYLSYGIVFPILLTANFMPGCRPIAGGLLAGATAAHDRVVEIKLPASAHP